MVPPQVRDLRNVFNKKTCYRTMPARRVAARSQRILGRLAKLLGNACVVRYLAQHQQELLSEFQKIAELESATA